MLDNLNTSILHGASALLTFTAQLLGTGVTLVFFRIPTRNYSQRSSHDSQGQRLNVLLKHRPLCVYIVTHPRTYRSKSS